MIATSRKIQHLYWRAGFGLSPEEWAKRRHWPLSKAIDDLFSHAKRPRQLRTSGQMPDLSMEEIKNLSKSEKKKRKEEGRQLLFQQNATWVARMADPSQSALLEKMCLFWHGHFACVSKGPHLAFRQLNSIRAHALGNFRDFVQAMARDVSMIRFLNNQQNKKQKPNENFARELMELFTIGRGHYSEQDIKEAARAFTGWSSNLKGDFVFRKRQHDDGQKTFMGQSGRYDGDDIINIILEQPACAQFICRKIYRFFVHEVPDKKRVQELADYFYAEDYNIDKLMHRIFTSDWFYAPDNMGNRIKPPVELVAGMMRQLKVDFQEDKAILFVERALGQVLFNPPNVAGWAGGKSWIDNSTLMIRLNLANLLFQGTAFDFRVKDDLKALKRSRAGRKLKANIDLQPLIQLFAAEDNEAIFEQMSEYLLQAPSRWDADFMEQFTFKTDQEAYIKSLALRLMTLPEYQLC